MEDDLERNSPGGRDIGKERMLARENPKHKEMQTLWQLEWGEKEQL